MKKSELPAGSAKLGEGSAKGAETSAPRRLTALGLASAPSVKPPIEGAAPEV